MKIIISDDFKAKLIYLSIDIFIIFLFAIIGYKLPFIDRSDFIKQEPSLYFNIAYFFISLLESVVFIGFISLIIYAAYTLIKYFKNNISIDKSN
jgi:hypothetical protein